VKIAIALSGGIDSSVSAYLLKQQGFDLIGITFYTSYSEKDSLNFAEKVCQTLNIPWYPVDVSQEFEKLVVEPFVESYLKGKTPNPCVLCNKEIKFGKLVEVAENLGAEKFATGHYLRIGEYKGFKVLKKAKFEKKDQTYFLAMIKKEVIEKLVFPLGELDKDKVVEVAKEIFPFIRPKESQDVCFLKGKTLKEFFSKLAQPKKGPIVYKNEVVGYHEGFYTYTIGQRRGLRVRLGKPVYVIKILPEENTIILGDEEDLYSDVLFLEGLNEFVPLTKWEKVEAKIRYRFTPVRVKRVIREENRVKVVFEEKVRGVTPGQVCAFYQGDVLLGGGFIC